MPEMITRWRCRTCWEVYKSREVAEFCERFEMPEPKYRVGDRLSVPGGIATVKAIKIERVDDMRYAEHGWVTPFSFLRFTAPRITQTHQWEYGFQYADADPGHYRFFAEREVRTLTEAERTEDKQRRLTELTRKRNVLLEDETRAYHRIREGERASLDAKAAMEKAKADRAALEARIREVEAA